MNEFQLYKKRKLNEFINDTILFFRIFGKDYFKKFLILNGPLLLALTVFGYFLFKDFYLNNIFTQGSTSLPMEDGSFLLWGILFVVFIIIAIVYGIFSFGFPEAYLRHVETDEENQPTNSQLLARIRHIALRFILFAIVSIFVFMPIVAIVMIIGVLLCFVLVGFGVLAIAIPAISTWFFLSLIAYIREDLGYFDALGRGWNLLFENFWPIVGSTLIVIATVYAIQGILSFIPYIFVLWGLFSSGKAADITSYSVVIAIFYVLSAFVGNILTNIVYVQQYLIYYSSLEETENLQAIKELDSIGNHEA